MDSFVTQDLQGHPRRKRSCDKENRISSNGMVVMQDDLGGMQCI